MSSTEGLSQDLMAGIRRLQEEVTASMERLGGEGAEVSGTVQVAGPVAKCACGVDCLCPPALAAPRTVSGALTGRVVNNHLLEIRGGDGRHYAIHHANVYPA